MVDAPAKLAARAWLFDTGQDRKTDAHDAHAVAVVAVRTAELRVLSYDVELEARGLDTEGRCYDPTQAREGQDPDRGGHAVPTSVAVWSAS